MAEIMRSFSVSKNIYLKHSPHKHCFLKHVTIWNNVYLTIIRILLVKGFKIGELVNANQRIVIILLLYTVCMKMFIKVQGVNSTTYYESTLIMYYDITDFLERR